MSYKKIILLVGLSLFITACASQQRQRPKVNQIFVTNISEQGLKIFSFSMTREMSSRGKGGGKGSGRGGKGGGMGGGMGGGRHGGKGGSNADSDEGMEEKIKNKVLDRLESKLDRTGYCREGYTELESYFSRRASQIRGECNEDATEEDRVKFINNHYS